MNNNRNKKYTDSKRNLSQENINLTIENQVIKRQLVAIRDMLNNILGVSKDITFGNIWENVKDEAVEEQRKKVMVCENCGRILVDSDLTDSIEVK